MTITKSIRLDEHELKDVEAVVQLMPGATEAGALKHFLLLGLEMQKRDLVVLLYARQRRSTGEIARMLNMPRLEALRILEESGVKVLDVDPASFAADLERNDLQAESREDA